MLSHFWSEKLRCFDLVHYSYNVPWGISILFPPTALTLPGTSIEVWEDVMPGNSQLWIRLEESFEQYASVPQSVPLGILDGAHCCSIPALAQLIQLIKGLMISWRAESDVLVLESFYKNVHRLGVHMHQHGHTLSVAVSSVSTSLSFSPSSLLYLWLPPLHLTCSDDFCM